jgi:hypothetical protein
MLKLNLPQLTQQVAEAFGGSASYVVPTEQISLTESGRISTGQNEFPLRREAVMQFARLLDVPGQFFSKLEMAAVSCPRWLQRRMVRNLCVAATDRLDPVRARKALAIMAAIERQASLPERPTKEEPVAYERQGEAVETTPEAVETQALCGQRLSEGLFRRCSAVFGGVRSTLWKGLGRIARHCRIGLPGAMAASIKEKTDGYGTGRLHSKRERTGIDAHDVRGAQLALPSAAAGVFRHRAYRPTGS